MIIYIGNKLSKHGYTPTNIETLGPLLEQEYDVVYASSKKNKMLRFFDIILTILTNYKARYAIIDTYSSFAFYYVYISAFLCRILKIKYIPILHGGNLPHRLKRNPTLCRHIFSNSYRNISPSHYLITEFKNHGYETTLIPNNIDVSYYPFKKRKKFEPKLLWVRSFHKIYNPNMAIDVLIELKMKYPQAKLCMVGPDKDGSMKDFIRYAKQCGFREEIKITGRLSKIEWTELSETYDIFINTTNFDNTPVSVIEAMALGLLVVSTNVGGIPYLVKEKVTGMLAERSNSKIMADQINWILKNPSKADLIANEARNAAESFDWERIKGKWREILNN